MLKLAGWSMLPAFTKSNYFKRALTVPEFFMTRKRTMPAKCLIITALLCCIQCAASAQVDPEAKIIVSEKPSPGTFPLMGEQAAAVIYTEKADATVINIAATALKNDIKLVTGLAPEINTNGKPGSPFSILIGTIGKSSLIDELLRRNKLSIAEIKDKWETFSISIVENPHPGIKQALVIAGSDARGTAFGVFELSKLIGVSPWYWWADVHPAQKKGLYIKGTMVSSPPSVKYRGIFLNDEDWGLQPWAAKTYEPETGDIGPKTYGKASLNCCSG